MKTAFIIFLTFLILNPVFSQGFKQEKRIYLLDITKSMFGLGASPDIFDDIKHALYNGIENINNPETEISIITFQGTNTYQTHNLPHWNFKKGDEGKFSSVKSTIDAFSMKTVPGHNTDIYSALVKAKHEIDPDKINYIFLLTDGAQSPIGRTIKHDQKDLDKLLSGWCNWSKNRNTYLFYVMLTDKAKNENIIDIVEHQCNAYVSMGTDINIAFIRPIEKQIAINLEDQPEFIEIPLTANDWDYLPADTNLKIELSANNIFELNKGSVDIKDGKLTIKIDRANGNSWHQLVSNTPRKSTLRLQISSDNGIKILDPSVKIEVRNYREKVLTLEFE